MNESNGNNFFDTSLLKEFREVVNSTNIFYEMPKFNNLWSLMCVLMDRLDSAINYLNSHLEQPKTEEDLVFFMVYASILKDGIYKFYENIYKKKPPTIEEKKFFINAHDYSAKIFSENNAPTDDVFFEYLRALSFAHPFGVNYRSGRKFMDIHETHYSPWVISYCRFEEDNIGLRVYSDQKDSLNDIFISFQCLKNYLFERYNLLKEFIKRGNEEILIQNNIRYAHKVDRNGGTIVVLNNICSELEKRFVDHDSIDEAIKIMKSQFKEDINVLAVNKIKNRISESVNILCDCLDNLDYEGLEETLSFLYKRPKNLHSESNYELEKIYSYLRDDGIGGGLPGSNEEWGLIQAKNFYKTYAKDYVFIDFEKMTYLQIKILVTTSLYLGKMKENVLLHVQ